MARRSGLLACLVAGVLGAGAMACETEETIDWASKPTTIQVTVRMKDGTGLGSATSPLKLEPGKTQTFLIDLKVLGGATGTDPVPYNGWVRVSVRPGVLVVKIPAGEAAARVYENKVRLIDGVAEGIEGLVQGAFGVTYIWAEDMGEDKTNTIPVGAGGVSVPIHLDLPTLYQIQYGTYSPFAGAKDCDPLNTQCAHAETVTVKIDPKRPLVVTQVTNQGMFVTDLSDTSGAGFNHMYVYNFNTPTSVPVCTEDEGDVGNCQKQEPIRLQVCDKLSGLSGILSEFYGFTELNFPSFDVVRWFPDDGTACGVPEPKVLSSEIGANAKMEPWESSLVRLENVTISDPPRTCDIDGDGTVNYEVPEENDCQLACDKDPKCTEAVNYNEFRQYGVGVAGKRMLVVTNGADPKFDPFAVDAPKTLRSITGILRHWHGGPRDMWTVEARCKDDIVITGEPLASDKACVFPRIDSTIGSGVPM